MKKLTLMLLILQTFTGMIICQEIDDLYYSPTEVNSKIDLKAIPKGTWKLIITRPGSKEDNFQYLGESLVNNNFQIDKSNKDFYMIVTVPRAHETLNMNYILNFVAKDSLIILTGTYNINASINIGYVENNSLSSYSKIENKGMNGSAIREAFREMLKFALELADIKDVEYIFE